MTHRHHQIARRRDGSINFEFYRQHAGALRARILRATFKRTIRRTTAFFAAWIGNGARFNSMIRSDPARQ